MFLFGKSELSIFIHQSAAFTFQIMKCFNYDADITFIFEADKLAELCWTRFPLMYHNR
jgi:hypothetical protein